MIALYVWRSSCLTVSTSFFSDFWAQDLVLAFHPQDLSDLGVELGMRMSVRLGHAEPLSGFCLAPTLPD